MEITVQKGELWTSVTATAEEIETSGFIRSVISTMLGAPVEVITPVVKAEPARKSNSNKRWIGKADCLKAIRNEDFDDLLDEINHVRATSGEETVRAYFDMMVKHRLCTIVDSVPWETH